MQTPGSVGRANNFRATDKATEKGATRKKQGARFAPGKGSHLHVQLNGRHSVFPFHGAKEMPNALVNAIKNDLGLK